MYKIKLRLRNSISKKRDFEIWKKGNMWKLNLGYRKYLLMFLSIVSVTNWNMRNCTY